MRIYHFLFSLFLIGYPFLGECQEIRSPFINTRDTILPDGFGRIGPIHAEITGIENDKTIARWHLDNSSGGMLLELEDKQSFNSGKAYRKTLLMADPHNFSAKWRKEITDVDNRVIQTGEMLFLALKKQTIRLDPANGNELWKTNKRLYFVLPEAGTGLFYPHRLSNDRMCALNLDTGEKRWEAKQNRRYGWDDAFLYDRNTLLIASEGITLFNINNGEKKEYHAKTAYNDAAGMVLKNLLGFMTDLFFTMAFDDGINIATYQDKVNTSSNIMSNVSIDKEGKLYLASANKIACLSDKGEAIWSAKLPKKKSSKSSLFLHNGNAYLLNRGYANYNSRPTLMGEAYLASFDLQTGEKRYLEKIYTDKSEVIDNFQVIGDILFVLMNNRVQTYDLTDGLFTGELTIDMINTFSDGSWFIDGGIYVKDETGGYRDIMDVDPELVHVMTGQGNIVSLNESLAKIKMYSQHESYRLYLQANGFTFLHHNGSTLLLHGQTPVAQLPFEASGFLTHDNIFYHFGRHEVWKIDLNHIPKNPYL